MRFIVIEKKGTQEYVDTFAVSENLDLDALNKQLAPLQMLATDTDVAAADEREIVGYCERVLASEHDDKHDDER